MRQPWHWLAFVAESSANKVESKQCPNGGTGRRARFRTWFSQGSGGSSPLSGTIRIKVRVRCHVRSWLSICFASSSFLLLCAPAKAQISPGPLCACAATGAARQLHSDRDFHEEWKETD